MTLFWSHQRFCVEKFELLNTAEVSQKMQGGCVCVCVCVCVCGDEVRSLQVWVIYESSEQQTYTQTHTLEHCYFNTVEILL